MATSSYSSTGFPPTLFPVVRKTSPKNVTALFEAAREGNQIALNTLFSAIYEELHRLARSQRRRWHGNYTVNTTALVHEAYLKLVNQEEARWNDRSHFFALAAKAMRHILSNYARRQRTAKRGGDHEKISFDDLLPNQVPLVPPESIDEVLALDEALQRLGAMNERQSQVVECRFFAGLPVEETAIALGISPATVKRDWSVASACLRREIGLQQAA